MVYAAQYMIIQIGIKFIAFSIYYVGEALLYIVSYQLGADVYMMKLWADDAYYLV
jgi:hypothetical protein